MKLATPIIILGLLFVGAIVVSASAYRVAEYEQAIVTEFGKPVGGPVKEAGLHWRKPFIHTVNRFEKRVLEHDGDATQIPTSDKKFIYIDTFARWRIRDPLQFYKSVKDIQTAKRRLDDIIDSETRDAISRHVLIEAVRNSNRKLQQDKEVEQVSSELERFAELTEEGAPEDGEGPARPETAEARRRTASLAARGELSQIELGREEIMAEILRNAKRKIEGAAAPDGTDSTRGFGIELIDVQIKRVNYVQEVEAKVFERMVAERMQIAEKYRAEGQRFFAEFEGRIEKERNRILSEAYREAEITKGEAEAEAAAIYANAYGGAPEFYTFLRTLEIYREQLKDNVSLIVSADSEFFRYLKNAGSAGK
jgi:membrane protease subunit HflC